MQSVQGWTKVLGWEVSASTDASTLLSGEARRLLTGFPREMVASEVRLAAERATNRTYFRDASHYGPWQAVGDACLNDLLEAHLPPPPAISSLAFLSSQRPGGRLLDFGAGLSGFGQYASRIGLSQVRWCADFYQVSREIAMGFHLGIGSPPFVELNGIATYVAEVVAEHGIWLADDIYGLSSVRLPLSDRLYNSGGIPGEGPFRYFDCWDNSPERFAFSRMAELPFLDVYTREQ